LKWFAKDGNETYSIPTIINGQISREKIRRVTNPRISVQGGDKIKKLDNFNRFRKGVKSTLLYN